MRAGRLTLACKQIALGGRATAAAASPVLLSGNMVQQPVRIPINVCGNSVDPVGEENPPFGNTCVNDK
jgi:hypothetical protein